MASNREHETRDATKRRASWTPPSLLPAPDPQDGVSFRWVRASARGVVDNTNISKRFREGWEPVNAKDHPELKFLSDRGSEFTEGVEIGGMLLCKNTNENIKRRNSYYENRAAGQMTAVDNNYMRENDPRMPLLRPERKSRTSFKESE